MAEGRYTPGLDKDDRMTGLRPGFGRCVVTTPALVFTRREGSGPRLQLHRPRDNQSCESP
jgi:hypothetical protein